MDKCLIFSNLEVAKINSYFNENQAPYPAQRVNSVSSQKPDKFKQIFSNLLHRNDGTCTYTYRTTQLHPDGEVRSLMREPVPSELQEVIRLAVVQPVVPGIDKGTSHCNSHRPVLHLQVRQEDSRH